MKRGQALIIAIFAMVVCSVLGLLAAQLLAANSSSANKNLRGFQALNIAQAGIAWTITTSLAADTNWANNTSIPPINLGKGSFSVRYKGAGAQITTLESIGLVQGIQRKVTVVCSRELARKKIHMHYYGEIY